MSINLPHPEFGVELNIYNPVGASDPIGGRLKDAIKGQALRFLNWVRGRNQPERSVSEAGPGDYRLLRKGQPGYQRLNIVGRAAGPAPQPTYGSKEAARVRVMPPLNPAQFVGAPQPALPDAQPQGPRGELDALAGRIGRADYLQPAPALPKGTSERKVLAARLEHTARQEAAILKDIHDLVRLARAAGEDISLDPGAHPAGLNGASEAFGLAVAALLSARLPGVGELADTLIRSDDGAALLGTAADHAGLDQGDLERDLTVADRLLGQAGFYSLPEEALQGRSDEETAVLMGERNAAKRADGVSAMRTALRDIGASLLKFHDHGLLEQEFMRALSGFQPVAGWATSTDKLDHVKALPALGETLATMARGNGPAIDNVLGGDSRCDELSLKMKVMDLPPGGRERQVAELRHTLARAKRELAGRWTQTEKVARTTDGEARLGNLGLPMTTRRGRVINAGGSDVLRVDTKLLKLLREGPTPEVSAREAAARGGAGMQSSAKSGKDLNMLIARVMLLQKHIDDLAPEAGIDTARETLNRGLTGLPAALRDRLAAQIAPGAVQAEQKLETIADKFSEEKPFAALTHAVRSRHRALEARDLIAKLRSENPGVRERAVRDLTGGHGVYSDILKRTGALRTQDPYELSGAVNTVRGQLMSEHNDDLAALSQAVGADVTAEDLVPLAERRNPDAPGLRSVLQGIHLLKAAQERARTARDSMSLGLTEADFREMGFSEAEAREVRQELAANSETSVDPLFQQGLSNTSQAGKVAAAVNNAITDLFVNSRSAVTQEAMRGVTGAFAEVQAGRFMDEVLTLAKGNDAGASDPVQVFGRLFSGALGSPDRSPALLLGGAAERVDAAEVRIAGLVADLGDLDLQAGQARGRLTQPNSPVDPDSASARANATRLVNARKALDAADLLRAAAQTLKDELTDENGAYQTGRGELERELGRCEAALNRHREVMAPGEPDEEAQHRSTQLEADRAAAAKAVTDLDSAHAGEVARLNGVIAEAVQQSAEADGALQAALRPLNGMSKADLRSSRLSWERTDETQLRALLAGKGGLIDDLHMLDSLPGAKQGKMREIEAATLEADRALANYRTAMASARQSGTGAAIVPDQLRTAIRFAVAEAARNWPDGPASFDPAANRQAIEDRLEQFGINREVARPEINAVLHQAFEVGQLETWAREAAKAFDAPAEPERNIVMRALSHLRTFVTDRAKMDSSLRAAMVESVLSMHEGDAITLNRGKTFSLDTTRIPVETTGTLKARVTVDFKGKNMMQVRRTDEGYEVFFKAGTDVGGSLGAIASLWGAATVSAAVTGGSTDLVGAGFRFDDPLAAAGFVDAVLGGNTLSPRSWAAAKEAVMVSDSGGRIGGKADAQFNAKNLATLAPDIPVLNHLFYDGQVGNAGFEFLGGVMAKVGGSKEWHTTEQRNTNRHVVERETTVTLEGSIHAGLWASLPTVADAAIDQIANTQSNVVFNAINTGVNSTDILKDAVPGFAGGKQGYGVNNQALDPFSAAPSRALTLNLGVKRVLTSKTTLAFERDGLLAADGAAKSKSIVITGKASDKDLLTLRQGGTDTLHAAVKAMRTQNGEQEKMLDQVLAAAEPGGSLTVTYGLRREMVDLANDLLIRTKAAEKAGNPSEVKRMASMAQAIYENEDNYVVDTLSITNPTVVDNSHTLFSLGIVSGGRSSSGHAERPAMILALPDGPTAQGIARRAEAARRAIPPQQPLQAQQPLPPANPDAGPREGSSVPELDLPGIDALPEKGSHSAPEGADDGLEPLPGPPQDGPSGSAVLLKGGTGSSVDVGSVSSPDAPNALSKHLIGIDASALPSLRPTRPEDFYKEDQVLEACAIHAINAFVGGPAVSRQVLTDFSGERLKGFVADPYAENASNGFTAKTVAEALTLISRAPAFAGMGWKIGISEAAVLQDQDRLEKVGLPDLSGTDRVVLQVGAQTQARINVMASPLSHFVTFRRDANAEWHLVDSRDTALDAAPGSTGSRRSKAHVEPISPQDWLDRAAATTMLRHVALIGSGVTPNALRAEIT